MIALASQPQAEPEGEMPPVRPRGAKPKHKNTIREVHVLDSTLKEAKEMIDGNNGNECLIELSGLTRGRCSGVTGVHQIKDGVEMTETSTEVVNESAANKDLRKQRRGRRDKHIGSSHSHPPSGSLELSSVDKDNIDYHRGQTNRQIYLLFHNVGDGSMGARAFDTNGDRIKLIVHNAETKEETHDPSNSKEWEKASVLEKQTSLAA